MRALIAAVFAIGLSSCDDDSDSIATILSGGGPGSDKDTKSAYGPESANGITITDFGYKGDLTPDSNSANGVGNHDNQMTAYLNGDTVASAALSNDVAQQLGLSVGDQFQVTSDTGQVYNLRYDDTAPENRRIDIYAPSGNLGGNGFSQHAMSVTPMSHPVNQQ